MAVEVDVEGALRQLAQLRSRLRELLEWEKLALQERDPRRPPGFDPSSSVLADLRAELREMHGHFLHLAIQTDHALKRPDLAGSARQKLRWRNRLDRLQREVARLGLEQR